MVQNTGGIDALLQEERSFPPPADFAAGANMADPDIYAKAAADPEGFWAGLAEELDWFQKWDTVLDWSDAPFAKWFIGGKLNVSYNCIDRHVNNGRRNKAAIVSGRASRGTGRCTPTATCCARSASSPTG